MTHYSVWAPNARLVELVFFPDKERVPMIRQPDGHHVVTHPRIQPGQQYAFSLDGGDPLPDPRSRLQPHGVHGPSCWIDDAFTWTDHGFQQVPLHSAVLYELHVGTFSRAGTFDGALDHLPKLRQLGITHVELMPVAHFPGTRGWGYDGVCLFAPHTQYGGPEGLKRFVNACHEQGIAVLLDVVYNHLGPSGNYLGQYGPYFTDHYHTPWGEALNFDAEHSDAVRRFICDNATHWLRDYHIDGLRLDAIHAIFDTSATHILEQLAQEVDALAAQLRRHLVVIAESGLNDARIVRPREAGGYGLTSQWSDDFHHALHTVLSGEASGYYADFGTLGQLAAALRYGFVYRGQYSKYRKRRFGGDSAGLRGRHFLSYIQNHDQIGNRAVGDRLTASLDVGQLKIAAALTLLAPFVPMLFMGEEWGTRRPFQYFTDHEEVELGDAVREGRRREFAAFGWDPERVPDPQARATFEASKLDWEEALREPHADLLRWHQALLRLRREQPELLDDRLDATRVDFDEHERWLRMTRGSFHVTCNFADAPCSFELPQSEERLVLASHPHLLRHRRLELAPRSVVITQRM